MRHVRTGIANWSGEPETNLEGLEQDVAATLLKLPWMIEQRSSKAQQLYSIAQQLPITSPSPYLPSLKFRKRPHNALNTLRLKMKATPIEDRPHFENDSDSY